MNYILFFTGDGVDEEVSGARFATLENEVRHITGDIAEIKESTKTTYDAIRSIDVSVAVMAESIKQNQQLTPRVDKLELRASATDKKMAAYAGAIAAISFVIFRFDKIQAFFN
jgi:hypothetical protein